MFVSVTGPGFPTSYVWVFLGEGGGGRAVQWVRSVDMGRIVDHHCLNIIITQPSIIVFSIYIFYSSYVSHRHITTLSLFWWLHLSNWTGNTWYHKYKNACFIPIYTPRNWQVISSI